MSLLSILDESIRTYFPLPDVCPENSEKGAWHLQPSQHIFEVTVVGLIALFIFLTCLRKVQSQWKKAIRNDQQRHDTTAAASPSIFLRIMDLILLFLVTLSACTIIYHKYHGSKMSFLLQPCHVLHAFLIYILTLPYGSRRGNICLSIYLCNLSAPFLGTVAVDLSCYTQRFEALNWGVQHISMMVVPLYLIATKRFSKRPLSSLSLFGASFTAQCLLHFPFLVIASIIAGTNINYVLCPPPGQDLLASFGFLYRPPMFFFCAILAWSLRFILVGGFVALVCQKEGAEEEENTTTMTSKKTTASTGARTNQIVPQIPSSDDDVSSSSSSSDMTLQQEQHKRDGLRSRGKAS